MLESIITADKRPGFHVSVSPQFKVSPNHDSLQNQIILATTKKFLSILRGYVIDRMVISTMFGYDVNGQTFAHLADGDPSYGVKTGGMIKRFMQSKGGIKYLKQSGDFKLTIAPPKAEEVFIQTQEVKQVMKFSRRKGWQAENPSELRGHWGHPSGPPYVFFHGREIRRIKTEKFLRTSRHGGLAQETKIKFKQKFKKGGQPARHWLGMLPQKPINVEKGVRNEIINPFYQAMFNFIHNLNYVGREAQAIAEFYKVLDDLKNRRKRFRTITLRVLSKRKRAVAKKEKLRREKWEALQRQWEESRVKKRLAAEEAKTQKYTGFVKKWNIRSEFNKFKATRKRKVLRGEKFIRAEEARTQNMLNFSKRTRIKLKNKPRWKKSYGTSAKYRRK